MRVQRIESVFLLLLIILFLTNCGYVDSDNRLYTAPASSVGVDESRLELIDKVIEEEIAKGHLPGATVLVAHKSFVIYRKAFGNVRVTPTEEKLTIDKIFDMASVTKPVATATSVMILVEEGKIRLMDRVTRYIPEFTSYVDEAGEKGEAIRLYHLLTHTSGLPPYTSAGELEEQYGDPCPEELINRIATIEKQNPPGVKFVYSCLGFITLAEIIHRVSGMTIDQFARERIFKPLEMRSTTFCPDTSLLPRIAPTEVIDGVPIHGRVHDPLAQLMDGKSGNAGLFSNVDDLAIFAQMMLNGGVYAKTRILSPMTVKAMTTVYPNLQFAGRGLGWDINTAYSSNRGDIFPVGSYGHTGFTGTSIWIDPESETFVILLTNRVHLPEGGVIRLRSLVSNIVASSMIKVD